MALNLRHQTPAQFAARFRARFKSASKAEACRLAAWVLDHLEAGDFIDLQLRNAFGLTAGQWTTLKAKLTTMRTNHNAVQSAVGE